MVQPTGRVTGRRSKQLSAGLRNKASKKGTPQDEDLASVKMPKINVLFMIDKLHTLHGGTERHVYKLARHLDNRRFNCSILSFDFGERLQRELRNEGLDVSQVRVKRYWGINAFRKAFELRRLLQQKQIDVVQTYHFKSDTYGALVSKWAGVKHVISSRRDVGDTKKWIQILLNKIANTQIDRFITVCDRVGERIALDEGVPREKRLTIYNGIELGTFILPDPDEVSKLRRQIGIAEDAFVVGQVAWFRPEKDYDVFFEAIARVRPSIPKLRVLAVGRGSDFDRCRRLCQTAGIDDCVIFPGTVDDVRPYLAVMDVACLVPGSNEGLSNAVLEKMAMGKPLIVTDVGGNAELVDSSKNGLIIPPKDPGCLAEAIVKLHDDPSMRRRMGEESRRRAELHFSFEKMIRSHEELLESIANSPDSGGLPNSTE